MKIFTVDSGCVTEGARVDPYVLNGAGVKINAIVIGEEGRGRSQGLVPVQGDIPQIPCPKRGMVGYWSDGHACECGVTYKDQHPDSGMIQGPLLFASVGQTQAGNPKLIAGSDEGEGIIVVFRIKIGYRGSNSHTGDRLQIPCPNRGKTMDYQCDCGVEPETGIHPSEGYTLQFYAFPGQVLARGVIAQGLAGRAGSGEQLVAVMPKGKIFRTGYSGRLYGAPSAHYYCYKGDRLLSATWEERQVSDIF